MDRRTFLRAPQTLTALGLLADPDRRVGAAPSTVPFHLESGPPRRIELKGRVTYRSNLPVSEWLVMIARPPELPGLQTHTSATLEMDGWSGGKAVTWAALDGQPLLALHARSQGMMSEFVTLNVTYQATLQPLRMMPGRPSIPVVPLPAEERAAALAPTPALNYDDAGFQEFLRGNRLVRSGESDFDFALRAFRWVKRNFKWELGVGLDRRPSALCKGDFRTDCGGSASFLVSILRSGRIPAETRPGRNVIFGDAKRQPQFDNHVRARFWLEGTGWVPVDMSPAQGLDDSQDPRFFGFDNGEFLTLHRGMEVPVQTGKFNGLQSVHSFQDPRYFVLCGPGNWQVTKVENWQGVLLPLASSASLTDGAGRE